MGRQGASCLVCAKVQKMQRGWTRPDQAGRPFGSRRALLRLSGPSPNQADWTAQRLQVSRDIFAAVISQSTGHYHAAQRLLYYFSFSFFRTALVMMVISPKNANLHRIFLTP